MIRVNRMTLIIKIGLATTKPLILSAIKFSTQDNLNLMGETKTQFMRLKLARVGAALDHVYKIHKDLGTLMLPS